MKTDGGSGRSNGHHDAGQDMLRTSVDSGITLVKAVLSGDHVKPGEVFYLKTFWLKGNKTQPVEDYELRVQFWGIDEENDWGAGGVYGDEVHHEPVIPTSLWRPKEIYEIGPVPLKIPYNSGLWGLAIGLWSPVLFTSAGRKDSGVIALPATAILEPFKVRVEPKFSGQPKQLVWVGTGVTPSARRAPVSSVPSDGHQLETNALSVNVGRCLESIEVRDKRSGRVWRSCPEGGIFQARMLSERGRPSTIGGTQCAVSGRRDLNSLHFVVKERISGLSVECGLKVNEDELEFFLEPPRLRRNVFVDEIRFPNLFPWTRGPSRDYFVLPYGMGIMRPLSDPKPFMTKDYFYGWRTWDWRGRCEEPDQFRAIFMPFFGQAGEKGGFSAVVETPVDACLNVIQNQGPEMGHATFVSWRFHHDPHNPDFTEKISYRRDPRYEYSRRIAYRFFSSGSYVQVAKNYQARLIRSGKWISFADRVRQRPEAGKLAGAVMMRLSGAWPVAHHARVKKIYKTFKEMEAVLRDWKRAGVHLYTHLSGWSIGGYDGMFPTKLPVARELGGERGLRSLARTARKLGFLCELHDNYINVYENSPEWDAALVAKRSDGSPLKMPWAWAGGQDYHVCPKKQLQFARRDLPKLAAIMGRSGHGIDVAGCWSLYECYDPNHPCTKQEDLECRRQMLKMSRDLFGTCCTECGHDYLADIIDTCCGISPLPHLGTPVPLYFLVYHGALTYIIGKDSLLTVLMDGIIDRPNIKDRRFLRLYRRTKALKKRLIFEKMTDHRFLNEQVQMTTFESGTRIVANFGKRPFTMNGSVIPPGDFCILKGCG